MDIGKVGVSVSALNWVPASEAQQAVQRLEELGYGAVWFSEEFGREAFTHAGLLLAGSTRIVVATGIANIWARDAVAMAAAHKTLTQAYPKRFLLGIGVSHAALVEVRGHRYQRPVSAMSTYLDAMDAAPFTAMEPSTRPVRVLAALGPKMLKLAAERAHGAYSYLVPIEHTETARKLMGDNTLLAVGQPVVLNKDSRQARSIAHQNIKSYLRYPGYRNNLLRSGFTEADIEDSGSDRLVDAVVAWGDEEAIGERIVAHRQAGADHVVLQVLNSASNTAPIQEWEQLAATVVA
jgi:probable F420-dependent oxidoreductase